MDDGWLAGCMQGEGGRLLSIAPPLFNLAHTDTHTHMPLHIHMRTQRLLDDIDTDVEAAASSLRLEARHAQRVRA